MHVACPSCQKMFTVPDERAGQSATCPTCGWVVPPPSKPAAPAPTAAPPPPRSDKPALAPPPPPRAPQAAPAPPPYVPPAGPYAPPQMPAHPPRPLDYPAGGGFFSRVFGANFNRIAPSWNEKQALESAQPPVTDLLSQKYLCWRRAMLWVAFVLLSLTVVEETIGTILDFSNLSRQGAAPFSAGVYVVLWLYHLVKFAACGMIAWAAAVWTSFKLSVWLARWGWLILFSVIFLQAVVPMVAFIDYDAVERQTHEEIPPEARVALNAVFGTFAGLSAFVYLVPAAFAILPGLVRASLTLKTLFPQSAGPGWLLVVAVPIYCAWRLAFALAANQVGVFPLLGLGAVVFALGPAVFMFYPALRRRLTREEAGVAVAKARLAAVITVGAGLLLILLFFLVHQRDVSDYLEAIERLIATMQQDPNYKIPTGRLVWGFFMFLFHVIAVASAVAVVAADCYVTAMVRGRLQLDDPREKQLVEQHEAELAGMRGLARLP